MLSNRDFVTEHKNGCWDKPLFLFLVKYKIIIFLFFEK